MKNSTANRSARGAATALSVLVSIAFLAHHQLSEIAAALTVLVSGLVALVIYRETAGRQCAEQELRHIQEELEERVVERTAAINTANVALQAEILERQKAEEALRRAHDQLEIRVTERTRELADANEVLHREIAERRKVAEALKNSRTLYHSLVESLPVHVWRTDLKGNFTFVNENLCKFLEVTFEELLGKNVFDFYTTATAERYSADDREAIRTGEPLENIHEFETRSGRQGFEQVLKTAFYDAEGCVLGVQGISWDMTERRQAEEEMRRIQAQVERTNSDLRRKNEEIQNFYHTLSHELKTPLTSAREFVSIVMDGLAGELNETQREYLGISLDSCNQLRVCINDLLDATRLETGKLSIELKPVCLGASVQRVVTALSPAAQNKQIDLRCEIEPDLPQVCIDEGRIAQVITNLLNNALKFTESGGGIEVAVFRSPEQADRLEVTIADTGRGIPEELRERIFDRLYQVRTGDASTEQGVGLGLYICRELVRLHGGDIVVDSEVGLGSTFSFTLPMRVPSPRANLLLVDDDPTMRDILRRVLERAEFDVATAEDGRAALQQIRRQVPDVVLMDLEMPVMDGPTTLEEIRKNWGSLPVVLHTGHVDGPLLTRALEWAPFTVLAKPCPMDQLVQTMRGLERRREQPASPIEAAAVADI